MDRQQDNPFSSFEQTPSDTFVNMQIFERDNYICKEGICQLMNFKCQFSLPLQDLSDIYVSPV